MLDKILPIHGKCLYLQYANNLNISIMKAIDFIHAMCVESIDLEQCNTVEGDNLLRRGFVPYFGLPLMGGKVSAEKVYFYMYTNKDWWSTEMGLPNVVLGRNTESDRVFLWELEN